jgi:hypothetical protein
MSKMFQSGYDDENLISAIDMIVREIKFPDEKDNQTLRKWLSKLKASRNIPEVPLYQGQEQYGNMHVPISTSLPNRYEAVLGDLQEMKEALDKNDISTAKAKLRRLTGQLSSVSLLAFWIGILIILFLITRILISVLRSDQEVKLQDEIEMIKLQFNKSTKGD